MTPMQSRSAKRVERCEAARKEARREALLEACKLLCPECAVGQAVIYNPGADITWEHASDLTWGGACRCYASKIRDLMEQDI